MDSIGEVDARGICVGILAFLFVLPYVYYLLKKFELNTQPILISVLLSALGHLLGAVAMFLFAITAGADSVFYFKNAVLGYQGLGYYFAFTVIGYARHFLLGNSFLSCFLVSGAIAFVASVYYLLTYKILLDRLSKPHFLYRYDAKQLTLPAFLLLCWPSYFFWSSALVKDNFAFLSIGMILFVVAQSKITLSNLITLAIGGFLGLIVRPYLFVIFIFSAFLYLIWGSKWNAGVKIAVIGMLCLGTFLMLPILGDYAMMLRFSGTTLTEVGQFAVRQQQYMNIGSSIPIPTHDPHLTFLFIPYLVLVNLFLPLGIGASNAIGLISSIENAYLLGWVVVFWRNRVIWKLVRDKLSITVYFFIFSLFGMSCLSIMNSNLGLAMREKMMYVPALLMCVFLTYAYRRMLILEQQEEEAIESPEMAPAT